MKSSKATEAGKPKLRKATDQPGLSVKKPKVSGTERQRARKDRGRKPDGATESQRSLRDPYWSTPDHMRRS